jgi:hypothetical protein
MSLTSQANSIGSSGQKAKPINHMKSITLSDFEVYHLKNSCDLPHQFIMPPGLCFDLICARVD